MCVCVCLRFYAAHFQNSFVFPHIKLAIRQSEDTLFFCSIQFHQIFFPLFIMNSDELTLYL